MICAALGMQAQGNNSGLGGNDEGVESLAERVLGLEKKNDMFNVYFNYTASARTDDEQGPWQSGFKAKELRFEITGRLTDRISYRFRHRLNKTNAAQKIDNFAKATDMMFVSYRLPGDKVELTGGKVCQMWGGFEYDENPMYIYQYSDFGEYMDIFFGGAHVSYKPVPTQEFIAQVTHTDNGTTDDYYGCRPVAVHETGETRALEQSKAPFTYIFNWNGDFGKGLVQTRWAAGIQQQAKGYTSKVVMLGQQLTLPRLQWYFDYMERWDDVDRYGIVTSELMDRFLGGDYTPTTEFIDHGSVEFAGNEFGHYFTDTHMRSFVTKARWEFAPKWKLMLKGMYDVTGLRKQAAYKDYRKVLSYLASLEYYPVRSQDFRVYLAYLGRHYDYNKASALDNRYTNRIELGFMYRIKCY